jgi:hypothetical protein
MGTKYEICRLKYISSEKRFLQLKDGAVEEISLQEIQLLYTEEAIEILGRWPNTWCIIMEEDESEYEDDDVPILTFESHEEYLAWRRTLPPALVLRGRAWTA